MLFVVLLEVLFFEQFLLQFLEQFLEELFVLLLVLLLMLLLVLFLAIRIYLPFGNSMCNYNKKIQDMKMFHILHVLSVLVKMFNNGV